MRITIDQSKEFCVIKSFTMKSIWILLFCILLAGCGQIVQHPFTVNAPVEAPFSIISMPIPEDMKIHYGTTATVTNGEKTTLAQWKDSSTLVFLWDQPILGETNDWKAIFAESTPTSDDWMITEKEDGLTLVYQGLPFLTYITAEKCPPGAPAYYCRSGFVHPLRSPSGKIITDDFPVGHTHQHALFYAWVNTTYKGDFTDFWNQQKETGTAKFDQLIHQSGGPVYASLVTTQDHLSLAHGKVLDETWQAITYATEQYRILDLEVEHQNNTADTLFINQYHYGGLGIRGSKHWNRVDSLSFKSDAQFLTSEGLKRIEANHTKPRWSAMYGDIDGSVAGVVVFDHPDNFRHPQPVRVHPEMPYYCLAPMVNGEMEIRPSDSFSSKFRILTFDGTPNATELDALWRQYAAGTMAEM